jgi:cytidyltransferase-like protein
MNPEYFVFVNGTLDLLHPGHIKLLRFAKNLGGFLVAALDSDARVRKLKGPDRPFHSEELRAQMVGAYADLVYVFGSDEELINIVKAHKPKYMVKGSDYRNHPNILGKEYCQEILYVERDHYSTTETLKNMRNR